MTNLLQFLETYIVEHFAFEENYMKEHAYPEYYSHRSLHESFKRSFYKLKSALISKSPDIPTILEANKMVVDWLVAHVQKEDRAIGDYISTHPQT